MQGVGLLRHSTCHIEQRRSVRKYFEVLNALLKDSSSLVKINSRCRNWGTISHTCHWYYSIPFENGIYRLELQLLKVNLDKYQSRV